MSGPLEGAVAVLVACIGFGSNYLPAKKVDIKDGQFFNVCMACGILITGLAQWAYLGFYRLEPFAALGGVLWAMGNMMVPFILARCGLGPGQLTWGLSQVLVGWATGKFGLFGKEKDYVAKPVLNYLGVGMVLISLTLFSLMKPQAQAEAAEDCRTLPLQRTEEASPDIEGAPADHGSSSSRGSGHRTQGSHLVGFFCALFAGVLFGSYLDPPTYLKEQGAADQRAGLTPRHAADDMEYVISHFLGIFLTTVLAFIVRRLLVPKTFVGANVVLPGIGAGMVWGIAQVAWFKANGSLSYVVSFPIIVAVPGVIAALWGCALFGENQGCRNRALLVAVIAVQSTAVTLIALSKD